MGDAPKSIQNKRRRGRAAGGGKEKFESKPAESSLKGGKQPQRQTHPQQQPQQPQQPQHHNALLLPSSFSDDEPTWYQYGAQLPGRNATSEPAEAMIGAGGSRRSSQKRPAGEDACVVVNKYRALGSAVHGREVQLSSRTASKSADDRWVEATMHKGTLKDRIAAMSVMVSNDPVHKLYALDGLLQLAGCQLGNSADPSSSPHSRSKPNSRVAQMAAQAMEDLFVNSLLPKDRKLVGMDRRPLLSYEGEGNHSSSSSSTGTAKTKTKATRRTLSPRILLLWRFEEMVRDRYHAFVDQYLSRTLRDGMEVDKKFCLKVASNLLRTVPEGESKLLALLVNKLGDPSRTVCSSATHALRHVLQQHPAMRTVVSREVQQLAHRPHLPARALYNCVNFLSQIQLDRRPDGQELARSLMTTYFRLFDVITAPGDKAKNVQDGEQLQSRLLSALLTGVNRSHPYLSKKDQALEGHMDTLYRVAHTATPAARTRSLLLLFHVTVGTAAEEGGSGTDRAPTAIVRGTTDVDLEEKRRSRFYRALYSTLSDPAMLGGGKHLTMYFNLLYKSLKYDIDSSRALALVKRVLATALHCGSPVSAASIFLVHEITKYHPNVTSCLAEALEGADALRVLDPTKRDPRGALVVKSDADPAASTLASASSSAPPSSQGRAGLWEIGLFQHHYHPSVAKFASNLGSPDGLSYSGDPLRDFGLQPFLDKFSYRNPKSSERDAAQGGPTKPRDGTVGHRKGDGPTSRGGVPLNDPSFLQQQTVDVQDEFFHKFFAERARRDDIKGIVRKKAKTDEDDEHGLANEAMDEQEALDEAEDWDGSQRFEDWEEKWETDPEEEAFVDSLTQQIIEDSIGNQGPDELDDEDPDMDGWDDMLSEDGDEGNDNNVEDDDDDIELANQEVSPNGEDSPDGDAFMEDDSSDNSDGETSSGGEFLDDGDNLSGDEGFLLGSDSSEVDEDDGASKDDGEAGRAASAHKADGDEDTVLDPTGGSTIRSSRRKAPKHASTFAALEEYEDKINESWFSLKRSTPERGNPSSLEPEKEIRKKRRNKNN